MFEGFTLLHVPREQNKRANLLAKLASMIKGGFNRMIIQEALGHPTIEAVEVLYNDEQPSSMDPIISFLDQDKALDDLREALNYVLITGKLYRRGLFFPFIEMFGGGRSHIDHQGSSWGACKTHIGGRALANKIARAGFYWSTIKRDCLAFVKKMQ
ncbi:hypothetical protein CR513_19379, partial [Mucuna pruriens]